MTEFERLSSRVLFEGRIASVVDERYRYSDGRTSAREVVVHPGAVAILAHDAETIHLVRQPREAVGEPSLLELPAGKLDVAGESPVQAARRELQEEVGLQAESWTLFRRIYPSPGFAREVVHVFRATEVSPVAYEPDPEERIEVIRWPLADLDGAIASCSDAKSLIGLLLLRDELRPS
ncbi:MAG: NUDIX hydrolase [Solirubrobacterales bacterium]